MKYYIGIDGGGTKTTFALADRYGNILSFIKQGSASYKQIGVEGVIDLLKQGIDFLKKQIGITQNDEICCCFGMPMFGENDHIDVMITNKIKDELSEYKIYVVNDAEVGWASSLALQEGVNIVSGTGSIAFGKSKSGKSARAGGWSEFFSDEGSCNWLGRRTMEIFFKEADYRTTRGALYDIVRKHFGLENDYDLIEVIEEEYVPYRDKIASLQLLLKEAAELGDMAAINLYKEAAYELSLIIEGVCKQLKLNNEVLVSYSGGLFGAGELILNPLKGYLRDKVQFVSPILEPMIGAVLLAIYYCEEMTEANRMLPYFIKK